MQISAKTVSLGNKKIKLVPLGVISEIKTGLGTGDNKFYLYKDSNVSGDYKIIDKTKVLTESEVDKIANDEELRLKIINNGIPKRLFNGNTIVPIDKGGSSEIQEGRLSNYYSTTEYYIDYSEKNVSRIKTLTVGQKFKDYGIKNTKNVNETKIASRFQNIEYYFKTGITFSDVGLYSPTYRINSCSVFDHRGNCIFIIKKFASIVSVNYLLGILCSKFIRYVARHYVNNTVGFQVDDAKKIPIPICEKSQKQKIENLVKEIIKNQKKDPDYNYQNHEQIEIDKLVYEIFGLDQELIDEVETWYARRYPKLVRN